MPFPYYEIKSSSKPIAIIKTGDRQLEIVKISKIYSKYFTTATGGVFELDDQYEYKYNKTGIYFYNFSNSKPLSLTALNDIDFSKLIKPEEKKHNSILDKMSELDSILESYESRLDYNDL